MKHEVVFPGAVDRVIARVSRVWTVTPEEIRGRSREKQIVLARHVAIKLAHEFTGLPMASLARFFGLDHTSVIHAVERIRSMEKYSPVIARRLRNLRVEIGQVMLSRLTIEEERLIDTIADKARAGIVERLREIAGRDTHHLAAQLVPELFKTAQGDKPGDKR